MRFKYSILQAFVCLGMGFSGLAWAQKGQPEPATQKGQVEVATPKGPSEPAFKVFGKTVDVDALRKQDQDHFFNLDNQKYQLISAMAKDAYLEAYWEKKGKEKSTTADKARDAYMKEHVKVSEAEVKATEEKYKDHPKLKELSAAERTSQIRQHLEATAESEITQAILNDAEKSGELKILFPKPAEPIYKLSINSDDPVRYGPQPSDTTPKQGGCKADSCPITIVEYSESQCPFCGRALPAMKQVMAEYEGKVAYTVRHFPLSFHKNARRAAQALICAKDQGKFWEMREMQFSNQENLADTELAKYAQQLQDGSQSKSNKEKFDKSKFDKCMADSKSADKIIDANIKSGSDLGVTGTPTFFVNGRRMSGALPFSEFKKAIDESTASNNKKS